MLSLKGCSLCGSHTRALLLVLRMFSPPLPSLPFQACGNCSQLVCVYTAIWHVWHLEDAIYPLKFHIRCFLVKLSRLLVFSNEKNADPSNFCLSKWDLFFPKFLWNGGIVSSFYNQFGQRKTNKNLILLKTVEEKITVSKRSWLQ